ncbi:alpha-mannosidase [Papiliotrema laurentii]|uniref:Alpha-mannosidase n=1 Tax=Papiliotrema laurentii TaxID=5418 RepID=A0AAD9FN82_PAPLA|nr:alpha-mannosidase [Papiliotrema laurentii]
MNRSLLYKMDAARKKKLDYPQLTWESRPKHLNDIKGRLNQFNGGHYSQYNLSPLLFTHRLDDESHVSLEVWSAPRLTKPSFEEAKRQSYRPAKKGEMFGPSWTNHWFKVTLHIPKEWEDYERVQLEFDCSGEAMVYTTQGDPIHGLTGGFDEARRVEFIIPDKARKAGVAHYYIEASCNEMFGQNGMDPPDQNRYYRLNSADLVVPNMEAWRVLWDFDTLHQLVNDLPGDSSLAKRAMWAANEMMNVFEEGNPESLPRCRKVAEMVLGEGWPKEIEEDSKSASKQTGTLWAIGHCHIDTAWLWPFSVTQQKSARSWSTQCDLMDRYPEHRFSATQAQQFKWLEQLYPSLFSRIKAKVAEGNFQPLGATWVEMDTNMPSGEALVRQFLYGQRYYESRFGFRSETFVLPDTFGYSSQLPQICRLSGAHNFFTQKLSWNSVNQFPHSTFNWVGLDGSQVLTHMTPVDNYNSQCNLSEIRRGTTGHKNLEVTSQALLLFGNGDGGGGPTPPMLEKLRRARSVGKQHDAGGQLPLIKMGGTFEQFFDSVREETVNGTRLPNWRGELYFELHRGTYTSHGSIKRGNRKSEILLREAEYAATMASLADPDYEYPKARLDAAWEDLLLCQFHDVLPGSGIAMIYDDAEEKYAALAKSVNAVIDEAHAVLYDGSKALAPGGDGTKGTLFAVNNIPDYPRQEVIAVPTDAHGLVKSTAAQISRDGETGYVLVEAGRNGMEEIVARPKGLYAEVGRVSVQQTGVDTFELANSSVKMTVHEGRITGLYDVALEKELIPEGQSGGMVIMEDHPNFWDAWDVDSFHLEKQKHLKLGQVSILDHGPLRATLGATVMLGQSKMEVEISLDAIPASFRGDARSLIRFDAIVDWREKHKFLKFELPLDIHSDNATYETQFGTVQRPTHRNTSWDAAKFEVCGHKFADLSEYGYGVAILNDCKYGYATDGNVMRLSLLRAPTQPDPDCDMGTHRFSWAIYPHVGTFTESDVAQVAYAFNAPLRLRYTEEVDRISAHPLAAASPFKVTGAANVALETIKRCEDDKTHGEGDKTIILRLFEHYGGHARATLKIAGLDVKKAEIVNLLEDHVHELKLHSIKGVKGETASAVKLDFRGYEIKTVRLTVVPEKRKRKGSAGSWVKL